MVLWQKIWLCAASLLATFSLTAQQDPAAYFSVPPVDGPELAARGGFAVGVRTLDLVNSGQVDILHFDAATGKAPLYDRPLKIEVWYPATIPAGQREHTVYQSAMAGRAVTAGTFRIAGKALRDAAPVGGQKFPLVVVSHGYPGSRTFLSYLTENLASKGYVVAAIDHTDSVFGAVKGFPSTLLNRSSDQLFTIESIAALMRDTVDASKVAIIGYSMGGYGALASAGADYSSQGVPAAQMVPGGYLRALHLKRNPNLKAVVAIAPWGAQPPMNSWDAAGLAGMRVPALFIVGDQDDVSGYREGVKRAFDGAVNSERYLLVFENARHNVGGNPAPPGVPLDFAGRESFEEPVWRKERINAINQHFISAFLDLYLKGDGSRRAYLHPSPVRSSEGEWPLKQGETAGATFSAGTDAGGHAYWKGFQRRWAVGLQMHSASAQATGSAAAAPQVEWTPNAVRVTNVSGQPIVSIFAGYLRDKAGDWHSSSTTWHSRATDGAPSGLGKGETKEFKLDLSDAGEAPTRRMVGVIYANGEKAGDREALDALAQEWQGLIDKLPVAIRELQAMVDQGASKAAVMQWAKDWVDKRRPVGDQDNGRTGLPQDYAWRATVQIGRHLARVLASSTPADALRDLKEWQARLGKGSY